ncbi:MAG: hypothetical protein PHV93_00105 [Candidatus Pacebacteria bacterium]|nr:hypothetical protein [Candidatus Paceibacterota bacterium]
MNTKYKFLAIASLSLSLVATLSLSANAADVGLKAGNMGTGSASSTRTKDLTKGIDRGGKEIDRRIEALTKLADRIASAKRVGDADKLDLASIIQGQITDLQTLKAKIAGDTDADTLKTDLKSITGSYRIFALVLPMGSITAAASRIQTIAADLTTISTKLQTRIGDAQTAGKDVTSINTTLAHMTAQIADARVQAQAAKDKVFALAPDNGDKTIAASNKAALLAARADVKVGISDLQSARKDAETIIKAIKAFKLESKSSSPTPVVTATSSPIVSSTPSPTVTTSPTATP